MTVLDIVNEQFGGDYKLFCEHINISRQRYEHIKKRGLATNKTLTKILEAQLIDDSDVIQVGNFAYIPYK